MEMLEIALAFAVTMLFFSTITSMVVELLQRVICTRYLQFRDMIKVFYKKELSWLDEERDSTQTKIFFESINKTNISTHEFIRKFAQTSAGRALAQRTKQDKDALVEEIGERFEEYSKKASQQFRAISYTINILVAVVLAIFLDINVLNIYNTLQKNETVRKELVLQADQAIAAYELQAQSVQNTPKEISDEELRAEQEKLRTMVRDAQGIGLPIQPLDYEAATSHNRPWLALLFSGLLIGLGGPFWYDVVNKLLPVNRLAQSLTRTQPEKKKEQPIAEAQEQSESLIETFTKASTAGALILDARSGTHAELGPRGIY